MFDGTVVGLRVPVPDRPSAAEPIRTFRMVQNYCRGIGGKVTKGGVAHGQPTLPCSPRRLKGVTPTGLPEVG